MYLMEQPHPVLSSMPRTTPPPSAVSTRTRLTPLAPSRCLPTVAPKACPLASTSPLSPLHALLKLPSPGPRTSKASPPPTLSPTAGTRMTAHRLRQATSGAITPAVLATEPATARATTVRNAYVTTRITLPTTTI